ncbi:putative GPI-anchored protein pfl2 [Drosophila guanche]|uniref:putative GPI-anchored protein pfl2 n=1 Tax=Drosophila guanche TaxID=7266 RepID=UPI0014726064|nr:putative GPI-anchored protein pfl2 [Drosophila guanche]
MVGGGSHRAVKPKCKASGNASSRSNVAMRSGGISAIDSTALNAQRINRNPRSAAGALKLGGRIAGNLGAATMGFNTGRVSALGAGTGTGAQATKLLSTVSSTSGKAQESQRSPLRRGTISALSAPPLSVAKIPTATPCSSVSAPNLVPIHSALKKSSLSRRVGGGKVGDSSAKRRVKFSANVHTFPLAPTKKSRIGELQLKKRVKKLKRNRTRKEGGSGILSEGRPGFGQSSVGIVGSNGSPDIHRHGTIVDVEAVPRTARKSVAASRSRAYPIPVNSRLATPSATATFNARYPCSSLTLSATKETTNLAKSQTKSKPSSTQPLRTATSSRLGYTPVVGGNRRKTTPVTSTKSGLRSPYSHG